MISEAPETPIASSRPLFVRVSIGIGTAAAILLLQQLPLRAWLAPMSELGLREWLAGLGPLAPLAFVGACVVGIGIGVPRLGFAAIGGISFGWLGGAALAQLGTLGGCFVNFCWARYLGRNLALRRGGTRFGVWIQWIARRPIATNVLLRLLPVGNSLAVNSFLGLCPISSRDFLVGTALGTLPETVAFALFGAGATTASGAALIAAGVLVLLLLAGIGIALLRAHRASLPPEAA